MDAPDLHLEEALELCSHIPSPVLRELVQRGVLLGPTTLTEGDSAPDMRAFAKALETTLALVSFVQLDTRQYEIIALLESEISRFQSHLSVTRANIDSVLDYTRQIRDIDARTLVLFGVMIGLQVESTAPIDLHTHARMLNTVFRHPRFIIRAIKNNRVFSTFDDGDTDIIAGEAPTNPGVPELDLFELLSLPESAIAKLAASNAQTQSVFSTSSQVQDLIRVVRAWSQYPPQSG